MNRILVIVFVLIITLPLAGNLAGLDGGDAEAENRTLAAFPHLSRASLKDYPDAFMLWFEDHFAFRAPLVRWSAEVRFFVLDMSPSPVVLKGRGDWLYYADDGGVLDYAHATPMTHGEVGAWREALGRAGDWLRRRKIAYVFMIAPDKPVIYPEYIPPTIRRLDQPSRTDQVFAGLAGTGVAAVDVRPDLVRARTGERLYDFTDTHWNDRGALVAYQRLIEAVRQQVPSTPPAWARSDFEAIEEITEGQDLAGMLGLKRVLREIELRLVPIRPRRAHVIDPPGAAPTGGLGRIVTEIPGSTLPRAVIFRDSFASRLVPFLSEHFSRAVYLWQNDFDANVVTEEHPDVVIEEIVGRHLYDFIASPELVPR
jgi:alginate O-acetyltransferase complex protein AlgJ